MIATNMPEHLRDVNQRAREAELVIQVPMSGPFNAEIAVVGEYPGDREVSTKIPFAGGAGNVLWNALRTIGLTRQHVYTTTVVKRQLHCYGKNKEHIAKNELQHWTVLLEYELSRLPNLKYIVVLGDMPLYALFNHKGITEWRGSVRDLQINGRQYQCVIANNPTLTMRMPKEEIVFKFHIAKLGRVMRGIYKPYEIEYHINPTYKETMDWLKRMENSANEGLPLSYDIEVISNETACFGITDNEHEGMCISFRGLDKNHYTLREEVNVRRSIQDLVGRDRGINLVAQNGSFDSAWLWYKDRIRVTKNWFDTLLAHHTLYPALPHNLGFLTAQYTDHPFYKDEKNDWREGGDIDQFWRYNIKDCCITLAVQRALQRELLGQKLNDFFFEHVMRLQPVLVRMTVGGILCDTVLKDYITQELREVVAQLSVEFHNAVIEATGDTDYKPNHNSPTQMKELLFSKLKLVGRGTSTDGSNRDRMKTHPGTNHAARKVLDALDKIKKEDKFLSTYAEMKVDSDKRIRCEYKQYGTQSAPGRLSSTKTLWGSGMNLQNQPERAHPMFIADPGNGFAYFDLAQAEARVVGWLANIEKWIEDFERARIHGNFDCHRSLAADMWNMPYDDVPTHDRNPDGSVTLRFTAKRCRHGLNYRMAADRLATTTGLPMREAMDAYDRYHRITPELRVWWESVVNEVREQHCLYNAYGRRLIFLERLSDEALESIIAFKPQSTIGDKVSRVMYQSESDPKWPINARIVLNIHDALICLAPVSRLKHCLSIMKRYAEEPLMINNRELIIPADCKISVPDESGIHRWSALKAVQID